MSRTLVCLVCAIAVSYAQAQSPAKAFSKNDVLQLLKGAVSTKRIEELALQRGIDFQITPEVETELRYAGANDELLVTLRTLGLNQLKNQPAIPATATLVVESTPGGVHVYVDDEPMGTTSSEGRLKISRLATGQHRVRLSSEGYRDYEHSIELQSEQTFVLSTTLQATAGQTPAARDSDAKTAKSVENDPSQGKLPEQKFFVSHHVWSNQFHPGQLLIFADHVEWHENEVGDTDWKKDNFSEPCANIKRVFRAGGWTSFKGNSWGGSEFRLDLLTKNYLFHALNDRDRDAMIAAVQKVCKTP